MIKFTPAKINIGLHVTSKRSDGYHNLETIFYPVKIYDVLEVLPAEELQLQLWNTDLTVDQDNLCLKAYRLLVADYPLKPYAIHLLKHIPVGAGLGGGSSDASAMLCMLNELEDLKLSNVQLKTYAAQLGADCPFFIDQKPVYAEGIGTVLSDVSLNLEAYHIVIVKPPIHVSTAEAYRGLTPLTPQIDLREAIQLPIQEWKYTIRNDFEFSLFQRYPQIAAIKNKMYELGASYASMSGSGSSVYGIFESLDGLEELASFGEFYKPMSLN